MGLCRVFNEDGTITETEFPDPPASPRTLSKTAFQDLAIANLGGGSTGMARFQQIMDASASGTGAVKFCFSRYDAALTFEKSAVDGFTSIMVGASIMTSDEKAAILNNWPNK